MNENYLNDLIWWKSLHYLVRKCNSWRGDDEEDENGVLINVEMIPFNGNEFKLLLYSNIYL